MTRRILALVAFALLAACTTFGRCIFPPHADLCDAQDFDPKCLLDRCGDRDGGPR